MKCFYSDHKAADYRSKTGCYKQAIKTGTCIVKSVGQIEVCGKHIHNIIPPGQRLGK